MKLLIENFRLLSNFSEQSSLSIFKSRKKSLLKIGESFKINSSFKDSSQNFNSKELLGNTVTFLDEKPQFNLDSEEFREVSFVFSIIFEL